MLVVFKTASSLLVDRQIGFISGSAIVNCDLLTDCECLRRHPPCYTRASPTPEPPGSGCKFLTAARRSSVRVASPRGEAVPAG